MKHFSDIEARAHLAAIVESSDDAIISKTLDGIIQSCNAAAERMFGRSASELIGSSVRILIPPELQAQEDEILARIRRGERIEHFETVRIAKDGRRIDVSLSISPIRDASGAIVGASKIARDITEQRRAAAELAAQQEWFRVTLSSIGDAVIACDPEGKLTFLNPVAEKLCGWTVAEAAGRPISEVFDIVDEKTRNRAENPAELVLIQGKTVGLANHTVLIHRNGTERPIADSAAPIRDDHGRVIGVVLVFRDITEHRRLDRERQAAAAERERLLEAERVARAEAERANRVKDDFVAIVSHELRTPLNAIYGWTELMVRKPDDPGTIQRGLDVVARNVRLQSRLISDLLDISRIVSGKLKLEFQMVDPASIINDAIDTVRHEADAKQIEIQQRIRSVEPVAGDPARLQQVVWNLLSNAVKFTPEGGRIVVALEPSHGHAEIWVEDNGIGIEPQILPHIFDRFRQGDGSISRRFGGLGLGLSIVKHLVELHGGAVKAESRGKNLGARFTIALPTSAGAQPRARATSGVRPLPISRDNIELDGMRVLVVDDEPDTAEFVKHLLEEHGAEVFVGESGEEGLALIARDRPDILISDIGMPDMDGYELMQRIRKNNEREGGAILAVALTAFARTEDRMRALKAGYQAHLTKPVEPAELLATIGNFAELLRVRRN